MQGLAQCPTCGTAIVVGAGSCPRCGTQLTWAVPGQSAPPAREHHRRPPPGRRGGSAAGLWVAGMFGVALLAGAIVFLHGRNQGEGGGTPGFAPATPGAKSAGEMSPFLTRISESYPHFYDFQFAPPPEPILPASRGSAHGHSITRERDRYRDSTFIVLNPFPLRIKSFPGGGNPPHTLAAYIGWRNAFPNGIPYVITLVFDATLPKAHYAEGTSLQVTADGKTIPLGREQWQEPAESKDHVVQTLVFAVKTATLVPILEAKQVTGRLGTTEFEWAEDDLDALRDFASRLAPAGR